MCCFHCSSNIIFTDLVADAEFVGVIVGANNVDCVTATDFFAADNCGNVILLGQHLIEAFL